MDQHITTASPANGASTPHDLFALTDEQILEIEPEAQALPSQASGDASAVISSGARNLSSSSAGQAAQTKRDSSAPSLPINDGSQQESSDAVTTSHESQATSHDAPEPPPWLAAQMKDPWSGEEARELWNGVQQAKQEAAAYRAAFATPEDARALKELYPGGVNEARAAANRARLLDQIDSAYFGAAGGTAEQTTAARAQLAQMMLREDPAAFREMVFAGLRALEEAGVAAGFSPPSDRANATTLPRLAKALGAEPVGAGVVPPFRAASSPVETSVQRGDAGFQPGIPAGATSGPLAANAASGSVSSVGAQHAAPLPGTVATSEAHVAAYAAFEKAANEDLERSVGAAIVRTIEQALPNLSHTANASGRAGQAPHLHDRLSAAVRQDIEAALKGDRPLGEQIAQILSARRFDNETRAQVVRLIGERAQQLVPVAAKRVLSEWTHATLAAHRGNASRAGAASRSDIEPALAPGNLARADVAQGESARWSGQQPDSPAGLSSRAAQTRPGAEQHRNAPRSDARRVDYRKLSDEQILDL